MLHHPAPGPGERGARAPARPLSRALAPRAQLASPLLMAPRSRSLPRIFGPKGGKVGSERFTNTAKCQKCGRAAAREAARGPHHHSRDSAVPLGAWANPPRSPSHPPELLGTTSPEPGLSLQTGPGCARLRARAGPAPNSPWTEPPQSSPPVRFSTSIPRHGPSPVQSSRVRVPHSPAQARGAAGVMAGCAHTSRGAVVAAVPPPPPASGPGGPHPQRCCVHGQSATVGNASTVSTCHSVIGHAGMLPWQNSISCFHASTFNSCVGNIWIGIQVSYSAPF